MDKKPDTPEILAAPVPSSHRGAGERQVPGAILERARAGSPEPSPAAAEPLPASRWPPVNDYLDEPDEVHRWERIDGERLEAMPATEDHGDPHFELDALVKAHLAAGYVGSTDLKTRVSQENEYASDTCVRRAGIDPATGRRYLEELVFEVVHKRSAKKTKERAGGFAARGVRRQIGIFVRQRTVREWRLEENDWGEPMDLGRSLRDPCLAVPLPLAALFDPALAEAAIARALEAKDDPVIREIKDRSEKRGEKRGRAESILTVLSARGLVTSEEVRRRILAASEPQTLERWLRRATTVSSVDELLDDM